MGLLLAIGIWQGTADWPKNNVSLAVAEGQILDAVEPLSDECKWYVEQSRRRHANFYLAGDVIRVTKGKLELYYAHGTKVVLHAPAAYQLMTKMKARMLLGRLTATVTEAAKGFSVLTPRATVDDLDSRRLTRKWEASWKAAIRTGQQAQSREPGESNSSIEKIVCFGDSITKRGYPEELAKLLGVEVVNAGVAGHTARQELRRMQRDVLDQQPDLAVIFFGTNDCRLAEQPVLVPADQYQSNLAEETVNHSNCPRLFSASSVYSCSKTCASCEDGNRS